MPISMLAQGKGDEIRPDADANFNPWNQLEALFTSAVLFCGIPGCAVALLLDYQSRCSRRCQYQSSERNQAALRRRPYVFLIRRGGTSPAPILK